MISLQQYRSSIGRFRTLSHREAKVVGIERKVKREARTAVLVLLFYLLDPIGSLYIVKMSRWVYLPKPPMWPMSTKIN